MACLINYERTACLISKLGIDDYPNGKSIVN